MSVMDKFNLKNKVALVTGAGGLLGPKHAEALAEAGATVWMTDWHLDRVMEKSNNINREYGRQVTRPFHMDVSNPQSVQDAVNHIVEESRFIHILINNAAKDPKIKKGESLSNETRLENMSYEFWKDGIDAAINGTFLVSQAVGRHMEEWGEGVILNIASDLGVIAPDQRIYKKEGLDDQDQNVKPITYSAAKWAVIGMTKWLATYYADKGIRVNSLSPTAVFNNHPDDFMKKLTNIIPMGRMSDINEYKATIVYMCSDASSYMTGHNLIVDGGKTVW